MQILWFGPTASELGWLHERIIALRTVSVTSCSEIDPQLLPELLNSQRVDRVIIACPNRWDFPWGQLQRLATDCPQIPLAVALSDWWLGWGRTGIGHLQSLPHLSLPWYRWWDGWVPWLQGWHANQFGPFPSVRPDDSSAQAIQLADNLRALPGGHRGLILAGSLQAQHHWQQLLGQQLLNELNQPEQIENVDWILWDDSRLDTWQGWHQNLQFATAELQALQQRLACQKFVNRPVNRSEADGLIAQLGKRHPTLWLAWTLPTWSIVQQMQTAGVQAEIIAKPHSLSFSSAALART